MARRNHQGYKSFGSNFAMTNLVLSFDNGNALIGHTSKQFVVDGDWFVQEEKIPTPKG